MPRTLLSTLIKGVDTTLVLLLCSLTMQAAVPKGWFIAGSNPTQYNSGIDPVAAYNGHASAYLKAKAPVVEGFGTLMQSIRADHYAGKRVRFSALVKTEGVQDRAGLWMRVDKGATTVAFDNMQNRPITGNTNWRKYEVVLEVRQDATDIYFGILLDGSGEAWISDGSFEVVGPEVLTTDSNPVEKPEEPVNLKFEQ